MRALRSSRAAVAGATLAGLACVAGPAAAEDGPARPPAEVALEPSFRLPQEKGKEITHTPAVVFAAGGKRLVTGTSNGQVIVWDAGTREAITRVSFSAAPVATVAVDAGGRVLIALLENGALEAVDPSTGKVLASLEGKPPLAASAARQEGAPPPSQIQNAAPAGKGHGLATVALAPDAKTFALARGNEIEVRRTHDLALVRTLAAHRGEVTGLAFAPRGDRLASVGRDGDLRIFTWPALEPLRRVEKKQPLHAVAFSPDGARVAFGGEERILAEIDLASGAERVIAKDQPFWITTAGYSPDGKVIAIGDESCDIWLFDVETKANLFHSKHHVECWLSSVAWAPDSATFLFGCRPNAHAGQPAIFAPNERIEALQRAEVQAAIAAQRALEAACEAILDRPENRPLRERARELAERKATLLGPANRTLRAGIEKNIVLGEALAIEGESGSAVLSFAAEEASAPATPVTVGALAALAGDGSPGATGGGEALKKVAPAVDEATRKELEALEAEIAAFQKDLAARADVMEALAKLDASRKQYVESFEKACAELRASFNVNQWKLQKK